MQIVWDTTTKLGVGIAYAHGQTWIVARYNPAENYDFIEPLQYHVHNPKGMCYIHKVPYYMNIKKYMVA